MNCPACGEPVERSARYGYFDAGSGTHHFCRPRAIPIVEREVFDLCNDCGGVWIKFGDGPRLHPRTHQPHICEPVPAAPKPPHVPSPPPREPLPFRLGTSIPRLTDA